jgi:hypothetical protein
MFKNIDGDVVIHSTLESGEDLLAQLFIREQTY